MLWLSHMHKSHQTCSPLVVHFYFLISYQKISIINEWCFQQGLIAEEKLDSYNAPYYQPYTEDLETGIENDGSFSINGLEIMVLPWDSASGGQNYDRPTTAQKIAKSMKAVQEPMLASHFGAEIMDPLFKRLMEIIAADTREVEHVSVLVSMTRKAWYHSQVSIFHDLSYCICLSDTCLVIIASVHDPWICWLLAYIPMVVWIRGTWRVEEETKALFEKCFWKTDFEF